MEARQPENRLSVRSVLQQVLGLGQDLICAFQSDDIETTSDRDILTLQRQIIEIRTKNLVPGQFTLWFSDQAIQELLGIPSGWSASREEVGGSAKSPSKIIEACIESSQVCLSKSSHSKEWWGISKETGKRSAYCVAAPIIFSDPEQSQTMVLGSIQVERPDGASIKLEECEILEALAFQSAMALQSSWRTASERWRRQQLDLVHQVSMQIASLHDLDEISRRITTLILDTFHYYYVAIFTLEPSQDFLLLRASAGGFSKAEIKRSSELISPKINVRRGQGIIGYVADTGKEVLANEVNREKLYRHLEGLAETRSEVALPLKVQDHLLGVLDVQSNQPNDFNNTDLLVLRALAGNIAIAVEGAQLYDSLVKRAAQLTTVYEVSRAVSSILDQEELLQQVVDLIHDRFNYPFVHLYSVHSGRRKIIYESGSGSRSELLRKLNLIYDLDSPQGIIPWVARQGETVLSNKVETDHRYHPTPIAPDETRSELAVPLLFGGNVLGVLDVQSDQLAAFNSDDRFLLEALAGSIAVSMRNANLYRSETWRRRVAESLREVAGLLSADIDLDQVLRAILVELERTLPLNIAAIWLLDEESWEEETKTTPRLRLAAVYGVDTADLDLEIGLAADALFESNHSTVSPTNFQPVDWLQEILGSEMPTIRTALSAFEPLGAALSYPVNYSALGAPLRIGDVVLGVLVLAHRSTDRYGSEAKAMTAAFASYAAVAIENARLYEEAHDQAWVSTVLLQVAEATQSLTDLHELLNTVISITPMLTGVRASMLYILDDEGTFVPAAQSGLTSEQQLEFERWRFAPGDVPALDKLVENHLPVVLKADNGNFRMSSILDPDLNQIKPSYRGMQVLMPLIARGEVLGVFLVDYSAPLRTAGSVKSLEDFYSEKLAILQGLAHQTAVAADNIRLLKAQKEEAYVSVALLQVAQAVVSSKDLDEALGSIVRITPILVGVKRAVAFLWDQVNQLFVLSQSYGIPRALEPYSFAPGEFPLLDAVCSVDSLLASAIPLEKETSDFSFENVPTSWTMLNPPNLEEMEILLQEEGCLLLAFPLSVKGKVLGVLLVEEPDSIPGEALGVNVNRRLREKRLEIITGISQQAALAIQNEQLQKEMLERERLERELQLAMEIQRAFLPQELPETDDVELGVYWRPAREVGGDFYDAFELADGRLGLVIGDVADKGMPAALFMTMVRTLVRATALQFTSPSEVVERVNELIVPDSPRGMFVTLVYAVLSPKTGELVVANAGHNPLLLMRQNATFVRIERGGMALGVEEPNRIKEQRLVLERGDILTLYTDGVTEAFSQDGEQFGENRLCQIILHYMDQEVSSNISEISAKGLIEVIDQAIIGFTANAPLSDDISIVTVKRVELI